MEVVSSIHLHFNLSSIATQQEYQNMVSNGSILQYFSPSLSYHLSLISFFVLSIFEWPLKTEFSVIVFESTHRVIYLL